MSNSLTTEINIYVSIRYSVHSVDYLLLTDVPCVVSLYNKVYTLQYSESLTGSLFMTSNNDPYMSLQYKLMKVVSNSGLSYNCCLLTVVVFKNSEQL